LRRKAIIAGKKVFLSETPGNGDQVWFLFENEESSSMADAQHEFSLTGYTLENGDTENSWSLLIPAGESVLKKLVPEVKEKKKSKGGMGGFNPMADLMAEYE